MSVLNATNVKTTLGVIPKQMSVMFVLKLIILSTNMIALINALMVFSNTLHLMVKILVVHVIIVLQEPFVIKLTITVLLVIKLASIVKIQLICVFILVQKEENGIKVNV